jgi:NAD(P)-dependent dehydrogenase (short-subunit alcohol dehydrogenase family)
MSLSADLNGAVALITGASSGLGKQFAQTLARSGARVALAARRREALAEVAAEITAAGGTAAVVAADVTSAAGVAGMIEQAVEALGPLTIVVNNAGIARPGAALELDEESWDAVVDTNLRGAWLVAQQAAKHMVAAGVQGSIINIASILAFRVTGYNAPYIAAKAGLLHLTQALALEWARYGIRVNAIAPGYFETDINRDFWNTAPGQAMIKRIPQRRLGQPADLDGALLLLASSASAYMTGSCITVDGGHLHTSI